MANILPNLDDAKRLAATHRVIPLVETLFSGTETPLSIYEKLANGRPGTFLLESAQQGVWTRYSFIGVQSRGLLIEGPDGSTLWKSNEQPLAEENAQLPSAPLEAVAAIQKSWNTAPVSDLPTLTSGLVGLLGWDLIREIENIGSAPQRDFTVPSIALSMLRDVVIVDHQTNSVLLVSNLFVTDGCDVAAEYALATARIDSMRQHLMSPIEPFFADVDFNSIGDYRMRTSKGDFIESVLKAKEYVRAGDVFQVVISQRFDIDCNASPLDVYRVLRSVNPSPYMYLLNFTDQSGDFAVVGSSPEALVTVSGKKAITHPIAGSRPRSSNAKIDQQHELELLADQKEKAEHLMLVDLARNDLLKVCLPTSVDVTEFMEIHRFSHIMHLVSTVEGELLEGMTPVDVFKATFPAGTLSGAPKPRALEIIEQLEPANRGLFGGVVGYFDFKGNADLAIAIRTAFIRDGVAHVQAGAGIVLDSDPESEYQETIAKASAPLRAVAAANNLKRRD